MKWPCLELLERKEEWQDSGEADDGPPRRRHFLVLKPTPIVPSQVSDPVRNMKDKGPSEAEPYEEKEHFAKLTRLEEAQVK